MIDIMFLRVIRENLLKESDKFLIADYPISPENLIKIKAYRQELRDYIGTLTADMEEMPELPKFPHLS
jgi:hypothetical protein